MWTQKQFDDLQAQYPWLSEGSHAPTRFEPDEDNCCVGGAFMRALNSNAPGLPSTRRLAQHLHTVGVELAHATDTAQNIIYANDRGQYKAAWAYLRAAIVTQRE